METSSKITYTLIHTAQTHVKSLKWWLARIRIEGRITFHLF